MMTCGKRGPGMYTTPCTFDADHDGGCSYLRGGYGTPKPAEHVVLNDFQCITISLCDIPDSTIDGVAERTGKSVEAVRAYLKSDEQDNELLRAFCFFGGGGPIGKVFSK